MALNLSLFGEDLYYQVAVAAPLTKCLTYSSSAVLERGQSVRVPLGSRQTEGVVFGKVDPPDYLDKIKPIISIEENWPQLSSHYLKWLSWMSDYYLYPIGQVVQLAFPPLASRRKRKS